MCSNAHRTCGRYSLPLKQNKKANAYEKIHENHLYKHIISYNRITVSLRFCVPFSPFSALFHRKGCKYRFSPNKSDDPCHINSGDASCRIDRHVPKRRRASCHKHLMVLIQPGKPGTEQSCSEHEPKAPQPINIQGQGKCQSQQKIFAKMCHLPYKKMNLIYIHSHLRGIQIAGGQLSQQEHHLFTDQHTQLSGFVRRLGGKGKDHIHHAQRRDKG